MMFEPFYTQDIDKALYVAEFHQEEEQEVVFEVVGMV